MKTTREIADWLDEHQPRFSRMADEIWDNPELQFLEFKASKLQADFLAEEGFRIEWDIGGLSTAFCAEWGEGNPIIAFAGEYDALPGLSQKDQNTPDPIEPNGAGHGCGHNLLGTGCLAAALAFKEWLGATRTAAARCAIMAARPKKAAAAKSSWDGRAILMTWTPPSIGTRGISTAP